MTLHRHHRKRRSQGGDDSTENIMLLTPEQHEWVHRNPQEAYERGWLVKSWQDPAEVPILGWIDAAEPTELSGEPKPGSECPSCHRRVPHPKKETTPATASITYRVPLDEFEAHKDIMETAAKFLGTFERPHWRYWTVTFALVALMQEESLRGAGHRAPEAA